MKKSLLFVALLAAVALLVTSCDLFGGDKAGYYPMTVGSTWEFQGWMTTEQVDQDTIFTSKTHAEVTQKVTLAGGEEASEFVMTESTHMRLPQETTIVYVDTSYARETDNYVLAYDSKDDTDPDTVLALPLEEGKTWTIHTSGDTTLSAKVIGKETTNVPAGEYKNCWKVEITTNVGSDATPTMHYWYADGVGRVKNFMEYTEQSYKTTLINELTSATIK